MPMPRKSENDTHRTYNHPCLIAQTLDVLGDRWTLLILRDLMSGLHRYGEILENCNGMSPNLLADRLKKLESLGLVERMYEKGLPPKVEYHLTEAGWSVRPILNSLIDWGRNFFYNGTESPSVGTDIPTDFAVRTIPAFAFHPERASGVEATLVVELQDCEGRSAWTFQVHDGHLHPKRDAAARYDIRLQTDTDGFFRFLRGTARPNECGQLEGPEEIAERIQACFQND